MLLFKGHDRCRRDRVSFDGLKKQNPGGLAGACGTRLLKRLRPEIRALFERGGKGMPVRLKVEDLPIGITARRWYCGLEFPLCHPIAQNRVSPVVTATDDGSQEIDIENERLIPLKAYAKLRGPGRGGRPMAERTAYRHVH